VKVGNLADARHTASGFCEKHHFRMLQLVGFGNSFYRNTQASGMENYKLLLI
jgi:hypothetical protein